MILSAWRHTLNLPLKVLNPFSDPTKPQLVSRRNLSRCDLGLKRCLTVLLASEAATKNRHCDRCAEPCAYARYQRTQTQRIWPQPHEVWLWEEDRSFWCQ